MRKASCLTNGLRDEVSLRLSDASFEVAAGNEYIKARGFLTLPSASTLAYFNTEIRDLGCAGFK
jgi:hypothetical protein